MSNETRLKKRGGNARNEKAKAYSEERRRQRATHAAERQKFCDDLTVAQRIERLDQRLGVGQGAKREREALALKSASAQKAVSKRKEADQTGS